MPTSNAAHNTLSQLRSRPFPSLIGKAPGISDMTPMFHCKIVQALLHGKSVCSNFLPMALGVFLSSGVCLT